MRLVGHDNAGLDDDHTLWPQALAPDNPTMLNFFLGTVAGGLIAAVLTITAARQPEVQARLGLRPAPAPLAVAAAVAKPPEPDCGRRTDAAPKTAAQEILFNRQRFWSVSP